MRLCCPVNHKICCFRNLSQSWQSLFFHRFRYSFGRPCFCCPQFFKFSTLTHVFSCHIMHTHLYKLQSVKLGIFVISNIIDWYDVIFFCLFKKEFGLFFSSRFYCTKHVKNSTYFACPRVVTCNTNWQIFVVDCF